MKHLTFTKLLQAARILKELGYSSRETRFYLTGLIAGAYNYYTTTGGAK